MAHVQDCYTVGEVAALKGVRHSTVRSAINAGTLKAVTTKGGSLDLIPAASAEAWSPSPGRRGRKPAANDDPDQGA